VNFDILLDRSKVGGITVSTKLKATSAKYKRKTTPSKKSKVTGYTTKKDEEMFFRKSIECLTRKIFICAREQAGVSRRKFATMLGFTSSNFTERTETPKAERWFFSLKTKEAYAQYIGVTVAALDAATEYTSRLLHEEIDDMSIVEAVGNDTLMGLAKAMDAAQQRAWDAHYKAMVQSQIEDARLRRAKGVA